MRYSPRSSVTALRTFSISTGLDASTVTPGRTAPDVSVTTPVMLAALVPCANTEVGKIASNAAARRPRRGRRYMVTLLPSAYSDDPMNEDARGAHDMLRIRRCQRDGGRPRQCCEAERCTNSGPWRPRPVRRSDRQDGAAATNKGALAHMSGST